MTVSIGTIAQQALRRLGVRVVPLDDSPTLTETITAAHIATQALVELGIFNVYDASQPMETVAPAEVATAALVELGVLNSDETPAALGTVPQATIATAALTELGVIASDETPSTTDQALALGGGCPGVDDVLGLQRRGLSGTLLRATATKTSATPAGRKTGRR
jgi:hypothetical protein